MGGYGLGEVFDLSTGFAPVDMQTGANTGKRVSMSGYESCAIVLVKAAGVGDPVLTLRQHTAASGGSSADLPVIDEWWVKSEATLDGDETWTRNTQAAAATLTLTGLAAVEAIVVVNVRAAQLVAGAGRFISLDIADTGAAPHLGTVLYILNLGSADRGAPTQFRAPLAS